LEVRRWGWMAGGLAIWFGVLTLVGFALRLCSAFSYLPLPLQDVSFLTKAIPTRAAPLQLRHACSRRPHPIFMAGDGIADIWDRGRTKGERFGDTEPRDNAEQSKLNKNEISKQEDDGKLISCTTRDSGIGAIASLGRCG
jgi:hypothetical protein